METQQYTEQTAEYWWYVPGIEILALGRFRWLSQEFKVTLGCLAS